MVGTLVLPVTLCLLLATALGGQSTLSGPAQPSGADPNSLPPSITLIACGFGVTVESITPAAEFDPTTATDAELEANGLPDRPVSKVEQAQWTEFVTGPIQRNTACPDDGNPGVTNVPLSLSDVGPVAPDLAAGCPTHCSTNWAGNIATGHYYDFIESTWKAPRASAAGVSSPAVSNSWVGLGSGSTSDPLIQAGVESDPSKVYLWFQILPQMATMAPLKTIDSGDSVEILIYYQGSNATFKIYDLTKDWSDIFTADLPFLGSPQSAEWIEERTRVNNRLPYLAKFDTFTFTNSTASYGLGAGIPMGDLPHTYKRMTTCNEQTLMAMPGSLSNGGKNFAMYWKSYGDYRVC